jgi:hypothetical protein
MRTYLEDFLVLSDDVLAFNLPKHRKHHVTLRRLATSTAKTENKIQAL